MKYSESVESAEIEVGGPPELTLMVFGIFGPSNNRCLSDGQIADSMLGDRRRDVRNAKTPNENESSKVVNE